MSIKSLIEISVESLNKYKETVLSYPEGKKYGKEVVQLYNSLGENFELLSEEIEEIFSDEEKYIKHFESDDIQDYISDTLHESYENYIVLKNRKRCDEKIVLAYEWLFEILLFTTDDEAIKSKITLNKNDIELLDSNIKIDNSKIKPGSKVIVNVLYGGKKDTIYLIVDEVVDDYLYCYLGDKENEEELLIFNINKVTSLK